MEMNAPVGSNALDVGAQGVVGKPLDRVDGRLKVTGGARSPTSSSRGRRRPMASSSKLRSARGKSSRSIRVWPSARRRDPGADLSKCAPARHWQSSRSPPGAHQPGWFITACRSRLSWRRLSRKPERPPTLCA